jgi:hypothetical protein
MWVRRSHVAFVLNLGQKCNKTLLQTIILFAQKMFGAKVLFKMSIVSEVLVRPTALLAYMAFEVGFMQMLKELVVTVEPCPAKMAFRVPFEALARFPLLHVPIELLLCKPLMLRHKLSLLRSIHAHFAQL